MPNNNGKKENDLEKMRTYTSDVSSLLENEQMGINVRNIIEEKNKEEQENKERFSLVRNNLLLFSLGLLLIIASVVIFFIYQPQKINFSQIENLGLIQTEKNITINISEKEKIEINKEIETEINKNELISTFNEGNILGLYFTKDNKNIINKTDFFSLLNKKEIPLIEKSIENFFLGYYFSEKKFLPFILFRINSISEATTQLKAWEENMTKDLNLIFSLPKTDLFFKSIFINNKNTRIIKDAEGNTLLFYLFIDDKNILISQNEKMINEIIYRLSL